MYKYLTVFLFFGLSAMEPPYDPLGLSLGIIDPKPKQDQSSSLPVAVRTISKPVGLKSPNIGQQSLAASARSVPSTLGLKTGQKIEKKYQYKSQEPQQCPHCKEFKSKLSRHLPICKSAPKGMHQAKHFCDLCRAKCTSKHSLERHVKTQTHLHMEDLKKKDSEIFKAAQMLDDYRLKYEELEDLA